MWAQTARRAWPVRVCMSGWLACSQSLRYRPAILVAILASLFSQSCDRELVSVNVFAKRWKVRFLVSEAYLNEHRGIHSLRCSGHGRGTQPCLAGFGVDSQRARQIIEDEASKRSIPGAVLFDQNGRVIASAGFTSSLLFDIPPPLAVADRGKWPAGHPDQRERGSCAGAGGTELSGRRCFSMWGGSSTRMCCAIERPRNAQPMNMLRRKPGGRGWNSNLRQFSSL